MIKKRYLAIILFIFMLSCFIYIPNLKAASYTIYKANSSCNVRIGPGTNYSIIKNGTDNVKVNNGLDLEYINLKSGTVNGANGQWYGVRFDYAAREYTGYVWSNCVTVTNGSYSDDIAFESSLNSFPESYKPYLRKLHASHNSWKFKADRTGLSWNSSVSAESEKGTSAISYLYPSLIFKDNANPNGIVVDGSSWYAPCSDAVSYYMDPRNFLSDRYVFMFEALSYEQSQDASVSGILSNTFMSGSFTENGYTKTYAQAFIDAARETNVSATHLASRAVQEMGSTMSSAASGNVSGYEGYYNFYNIGATSGTDNYLKGLAYAKNKGWNSRQKAITEGARFIGDSYIAKGQNTIYFEKFNTSSNRKYSAYTHQYMTNILAPSSESNSVFTTYSNKGRLNESYTFTIPVYDSMPSTAFKVSKTNTVGGNDTVTTTTKAPTTTTTKINTTTTKVNTTTKKQEVTTTKPVDTAPNKVSKAGYRLKGNYLSGLSLGMSVSTLKSKLLSAGADTSIVNSSWNIKTSGNIATGDKVGVDEKVYEAVVYGDVAGNGTVSIKDLLLVQKHLLGSTNISGAKKEAADVSKDGKVTIKDLLLVQKHLLGTGKINQ